MDIETGTLIVTFLTKVLTLLVVALTIYWFFSSRQRKNEKVKENVDPQDKIEGNLKSIRDSLDSIDKSLDRMIQASNHLNIIRSVNQRWIDEYNRQQSVQTQTKADEVPYSPITNQSDIGLGPISTKVTKE